jgi:hypothetical protein
MPLVLPMHIKSHHSLAALMHRTDSPFSYPLVSRILMTSPPGNAASAFSSLVAFAQLI